MFVVFMSGVAIGIAFGIVFHYWWIRPDIKDLKLHIEKTEKQLDTITSYALRNADVKVVRNNIKKIETKKSKS